MDYKLQCIEKIKELTNCKNARLTTRGNRAILLALKLAKEKGSNRVLIPDQGGWLTYRQYPKKLKLDYTELKTNDGLIDLDKLKLYNNSILLISTFAGYAAEQPMKEISDICKKNNLFLIEDASGGIGLKRLKEKQADIIVASFGEWKTVDLGYGGCIASDLELPDEIYKGEWDYKRLLEKLNNAEDRTEFLTSKVEQIKKELIKKGIKVYHKNKKGLVVLTENKKEVIDYCKKNNYEYTICPRYIRINKEAICIEVKRLQQY